MQHIKLFSLTDKESTLALDLLYLSRKRNSVILFIAIIVTRFDCIAFSTHIVSKSTTICPYIENLKSRYIRWQKGLAHIDGLIFSSYLQGKGESTSHWHLHTNECNFALTARRRVLCKCLYKRLLRTSHFLCSVLVVIIRIVCANVSNSCENSLVVSQKIITRVKKDITCLIGPLSKNKFCC